MHRRNNKLMFGDAQAQQQINAWCTGVPKNVLGAEEDLLVSGDPPCNFIQFKNFHYPTRGNFAAVMAGS